jgi:hypothetical protein
MRKGYLQGDRFTQIYFHDGHRLRARMIWEGEEIPEGVFYNVEDCIEDLKRHWIQ